MPLIAVTAGEPAGIGPDIVLQLGHSSLSAIPVVIGSPELLAQRARQLGITIALRAFDPAQPPVKHQPGLLYYMAVPLIGAVNAGQANPENAAYVLQTLREAVSGCQQGRWQAMVTAPVNKGIINDAGTRFSGHTEYLAELTDSTPVMMLVSPKLRVALVTTHLPLKEVADAITRDKLITVITILHHDLVHQFSIQQPRILVLGLNPHAGEAGHLGLEEQQLICPVLESLRAQGMQLTGPLPADTAFSQANLDAHDAVLAMYHDQGLPVLKYSGFGEAINVTLGLPIIRTSVDHGTAFELAGSGNARADSLIAAFQLATTLVHARA